MREYKFKVHNLIMQCGLFLFFAFFCVFVQAIGLKCESANDIQQKYLNLHINYSNSNKNKNLLINRFHNWNRV